MKKLLLTVYFAPFAFFLTGEALAFPNILQAWQEKYSGVSSSDTVNCQLCHWNSTGGDPWNDYGWALRVKYIENSRTNINLAFEQVETDDSDGDITTSNNLKEIQANTQPGWTAEPKNTTHYKSGVFVDKQIPPAELAGIVLDPTPADISVTPGSVDFAMVKIRRSGNADVKIANVGLDTLVIDSINPCAEPQTSNEFSWTSLGNYTINSGGAEILTVSFSPVDAGEETGCLEIVSNDPDQGSEKIYLAGEGVKKVESDGGGGPGGGGSPGDGGGSKLSLTKILTGEDEPKNGIAESGEILTYTITISNGGKKDAFTDVTETVPAATVHAGSDDFSCSPVAAGTSCVKTGVLIPGRGSVPLTFRVKVDSPFNDIQNTVSATGVDCADSANTCSTNTPASLEGLATLARHLINRTSYGITPSQLVNVKAGFDLADYRDYQLDPTRWDSTRCLEPVDAQSTGSVLAPFLTLPIESRNDLQNYAILMAAYNDCQLREVLTQFWDNHFNTDWDAVNSKSGGIASQTTIWELAENDAFRANALGNFRDLVEISAKSPAMLYYLDGVTNVVGAPNENYARELMELHTMSVDGGYTGTDVANVAKAFTGWTVDGSGNFICDSDDHDYVSEIELDLDSKEALIKIPNTNCEEAGQAVIDELIALPVTHEFICQKLTELLVNDNMTPAVVSACESVFSSSITEPDQIARVVEAILTSTEFENADDYLDKVKTPLEFSAGYLRNFDIVNSDVTPSGDLNDLRSELDQMSMSLFRFNTPDGFPEQSEDWVDSGLMQRRYRFISDMAFNTSATGDIYLDPIKFFVDHTPDSTAVQIVDYLMDLAMQNQHTALERDAALAILNNTSGFDGGTNFDDPGLDVGIKENRLRTLLAAVLNYPGYQYQ